MELSKVISHDIVYKSDSITLVRGTECPNEGKAKVNINLFRPDLFLLINRYCLFTTGKEILKEIANGSYDLDRNSGHRFFISHSF